MNNDPANPFASPATTSSTPIPSADPQSCFGGLRPDRLRDNGCVPRRQQKLGLPGSEMAVANIARCEAHRW